MASEKDAVIPADPGKRNLRRVSIGLVAGGVIALVYVGLVWYAEAKIKESLALNHAKCSGLQVNLLSRSLAIQDFELLSDDQLPYSIRLKAIRIEGIHLYQLMKYNKILIDNVQLDSGRILYDKSIQQEPGQSTNSKFKILFVQHLSVARVIGQIRSDTIVNFSALLDFKVAGALLNLDSVNPTYSLKAFNGGAKKISINRTSGTYGADIASFQFDSETARVTVDSALLIPNYGKFEFAHHLGEQTTRVSLSVPRLILEGMTIDNIMDSTFAPSRIEIAYFDLHAFRDKRVPFLRKKPVPLPMESFLKLPFAASTDTLAIIDSRITVEEIAETGTESGTLTIEHVNALASGFNNRNTGGDPTFAAMKATGLLMGIGEIKASFSFPLDGSPTYHTSGSISKMPLVKINPMLENVTRFRIESGVLNRLDFNFHYTDWISTGEVQIDYEDLQITGLRKEKDEKSGIKTFLVNTLVRNDKSKSMSKLLRTGKINIERDRKRFVFNLWWKSILDGLKSTVLEYVTSKPKRK